MCLSAFRRSINVHRFAVSVLATSFLFVTGTADARLGEALVKFSAWAGRLGENSIPYLEN